MTQTIPFTYFPEILGVFGFLTYATADILLSLRKINSDDCMYYILCAFAAVLLTGGLLFNFNLGAFLTEIFCLGTCVLAIGLRLNLKRKSPATRQTRTPVGRDLECRYPLLRQSRRDIGLRKSDATLIRKRSR